MIQNVSLKCIRGQNVILKIQDGGRWPIRLNERPVLHHDRDLFILRWRLSATSVFLILRYRNFRVYLVKYKNSLDDLAQYGITLLSKLEIIE